MSNKNVRSKIWLYAVILFTSAFIVLLLTAYSQIKFNKNLNYLNNQLYTKEHEKNQVQLSFANAQEINNKLTEENKILQEEKDRLAAELEQLQSYTDAIGELNKSKLDAYDKLCQAQNENLKGNAVESAEIIENINATFLDGFGTQTYNTLKAEVFDKAGKILVDEGYKLYLKNNYTDASKKLLQSWKYAPEKDYSAKCLYYLAQSEAKSGNTTAGVEHMKTLVNKYPSSGYIRSAKRFLDKYSG